MYNALNIPKELIYFRIIDVVCVTFVSYILFFGIGECGDIVFMF